MKIKLKNKLDLLIKDSGVNSFEEMSQRLTKNQKHKIGRTTISRLARNENASFNIELLEAICNELECLPGDLFETTITEADPDYVESLQSRIQPFKYGSIHLARPHASRSEAGATDIKNKASKDAVDDEDMEAILGPNVSHLSKAKLDK